MTLKIETTAPAASTVAGQVEPVTSSRIAARPASWPSKSADRLGGDGDDGHEHVELVTITRAMMIASGRFRRGFLTSSPAVETASRPM